MFEIWKEAAGFEWDDANKSAISVDDAKNLA
jgi:hypothetical protein